MRLWMAIVVLPMLTAAASAQLATPSTPRDPGWQERSYPELRALMRGTTPDATFDPPADPRFVPPAELPQPPASRPLLVAPETLSSEIPSQPPLLIDAGTTTFVKPASSEILPPGKIAPAEPSAWAPHGAAEKAATPPAQLPMQPAATPAPVTTQPPVTTRPPVTNSSPVIPTDIPPVNQSYQRLHDPDSAFCDAGCDEGCCHVGCDGCDDLFSCGTDHHGRFLPFVWGGPLGTNDRALARFGFFVPLWQNPDSLIFTDLRGDVDDHGAGEGNFGIGYRTYLDPYWIFGIYGYYDLLASNQDNFFSQGTIGAELLSVDCDFRINGHFPGSDDQGASTATGISNGTIITRSFRERAYGGVDGEFGKRILHWGWNDGWQVYWFLGGYYFDNHAPNSLPFSGPRTRLEMRVYDLAWFGLQSRVELGVEASYDRVRDGQVAGFARLRIPLWSKTDRSRLDPLRRRMLDLPIRDIE